jgi:hypothetical protein
LVGDASTDVTETVGREELRRRETSDDGNPPLELSERTEQILASRD